MGVAFVIESFEYIGIPESSADADEDNCDDLRSKIIMSTCGQLISSVKEACHRSFYTFPSFISFNVFL